MDNRRALLGLVIFVFVTTVISVAILGGIPSLHVQAIRFFHGEEAKNIPGSDPTRHSTRSQHSAAHDQPSLANATSNTPPRLNNTRQMTKKPAAQPGVTNRPMTCQRCFRPDLSNLTAVPEVCATGSPNATAPEMMMMITTTLDGLERRQAIRDTWASVTKGNTAHVRHVFLLGTDKEGKVTQELREESARYQDILVSHFVDVYANLTYKTLAGMHYLVEHCAKAKFFLKTDQDMYVFVDHILDLVRKNQQTLQTSLGGSCYQTGNPWRDPKTKYYASVQSYPQKTYPGFCSGTGYVGSMNVARKIVEASPNVPFFHLEDVYLALVLRQVGYKLTRYQGFLEGVRVCGLRGSSKAKNAMTIHELSPQKIRELWEKKCAV